MWRSSLGIYIFGLCGAVERLLSQLADPSRPAQHIRLPLTLAERALA
jgi:hypothetical protein